ncbi:hypothetical protein N4T20_03355 [Flavobacterium sp. TR2]|uniref:hypothetical protein n=1 Tax=Flavobacterium sp. TR2 TaxID=2977321 RepID=UPI0021B095F6|nr:hypothetical protein [Flavobacterium sp. TR2]UWY28967.1 hypothetical protein N4T20_03355 [Flavobacterium sp. TR2]
MKNLKAPFLVIALFLLNVSLVAAKEELPEPGNATNTMDASADDDCPACPPKFPIDQNISFLLVGGLALGGVAIYRNYTKKASV